MISAIILAGGRGKRMGKGISKQYIEIAKKPILFYTIKRFMNCDEIHKIILVLPEDEIDFCKTNVIDKYKLKVDKIVPGGSERQDSVYNGLKYIDDEDIVLIHDGARPFVSEKIIKEGIKYASVFGAAASGVTPKDTVKIKDKEGFSQETPVRDKLVAIQTPQIFKGNIIKECHSKVKKAKINVTDDTMVVEEYGNKVYLYEGEYTNIKVTTPEDLILAEYLVNELIF